WLGAAVVALDEQRATVGDRHVLHRRREGSERYARHAQRGEAPLQRQFAQLAGALTATGSPTTSSTYNIRTATMAAARVGTATMSPRKPKSSMKSACVRIVSTGGASTPPFMSRGIMRWLSKKCRARYTAATSSAFCGESRKPIAIAGTELNTGPIVGM